MPGNFTILGERDVMKGSTIGQSGNLESNIHLEFKVMALGVKDLGNLEMSKSNFPFIFIQLKEILESGFVCLIR